MKTKEKISILKKWCKDTNSISNRKFHVLPNIEYEDSYGIITSSEENQESGNDSDDGWNEDSDDDIYYDEEEEEYDDKCKTQ